MPEASPIAVVDDYRGWVFDARFFRNCWQWVCFKPQRTSSDIRIDSGLCPPCSFIARVMDLAMMAPAQRDGKLIAHLTAQRAILRKA
jgi:hypothetical protein